MTPEQEFVAQGRCVCCELDEREACNKPCANSRSPRIMMTPQDALESAIADYAALNHGQVVSEREMAEHVIAHMRQHHGYTIWRSVASCYSFEAQHD